METSPVQQLTPRPTDEDEAGPVVDVHHVDEVVGQQEVGAGGGRQHEQQQVGAERDGLRRQRAPRDAAAWVSQLPWNRGRW